MISGIDIEINNGIVNKIHAIIFYTDKICYINDREYKVNDDILTEIKNIILTWDNEYIGNNKNIDEEEFKVVVHSDTGKDIYHGKGAYPNNYKRLKEILGDINGR